MRRLQTKFIADISRYTENFFLGMSPRQTVFAVSGGAVMAAGSFLSPAGDVLPMLAGIALIMLGFFRPDGLTPERYLLSWLESHFLRPARRHYEPDSTEYDFLWEGRIGGRVCFRPGDYLKDAQVPPEADPPAEETKEESMSTAANAIPDYEADWPQLDLPQTAPETPPAAPAPAGEAQPEKPAAKKAPAKKRRSSAKSQPAPKAAAEVLSPSRPQRVPRYGAGKRPGGSA